MMLITISAAILCSTPEAALDPAPSKGCQRVPPTATLEVLIEEDTQLVKDGFRLYRVAYPGVNGEKVTMFTLLKPPPVFGVKDNPELDA